MDRRNSAHRRGCAWCKRAIAAAPDYEPHDGRNGEAGRQQYHRARAPVDLALARRGAALPDLLYSICVYDLGAANGAVRVSMHDAPETYWSVSVFDADTNNFLALNDQQVKSGATDFVLIAAGTSVVAGKLPVIAAPTNRGIVLFRTLVNDETHIAEIDAARHYAACEPYDAHGQVAVPRLSQ